MAATQGAAAPFVICENLVKIYKIADLEVVALQGLDLEIPKGEILAIVGSSGSGKSTLLNILGGLDRPTAGKVSVGGVDLLKLSSRGLTRYRRDKVGFVWQQTSRKPLRLARVWAGELLDAVGLAERRHHRLAQLSGGQQQRVAIALALANEPELLLADEPTGEVDSATARVIWQTFRDLNARYGLTTVIVTHDPKIAQQVDRVVSIRDGKTSTETVRQVANATTAPCPPEGPLGAQRAEEAPTEASYEEFVVLDAAGRLQVPRDFLEELGIGTRAKLELTEDGVLIRPVDGGKGAAAAGNRREEELVQGSLYADEDLPPPPPQARWRRTLGGLGGRLRGRGSRR